MVFDENVDLVDIVPADRARSSATSRAGSASRAGSGPSARRSCSHRLVARPRDRLARRRARAAERDRRRRCATRRSAGSARPAASAVAVGDRHASTLFGRGRRVSRSSRSARRARLIDARDRRRAGPRPGGLDDPRRLPRRGHRHADALLRREPDAGQRLPGVRRRGRGLARARARVLAQGRGRDGGPDRLRARPALAQAGARVPRLVGRPVARRPRRTVDRWHGRRTAPTRRASARRPSPRPAGERDAREPGHHHAPDGGARPRPSPSRSRSTTSSTSATTRKCILCYKCVEACGEDAQNTFAIAVAGRGFDARISTEYAVPLPESACVYCGNCIGVCPTGALMFTSRARHARGRHVGRVRADRDRHDLPVLRRRLRRSSSTSRTTRSSRSPRRSDSSVTDGHLCIKGRFGFEFVQNRRAAVRTDGGPACLRSRASSWRAGARRGSAATSSRSPTAGCRCCNTPCCAWARSVRT